VEQKGEERRIGMRPPFPFFFFPPSSSAFLVEGGPARSRLAAGEDEVGGRVLFSPFLFSSFLRLPSPSPCRHSPVRGDGTEGGMEGSELGFFFFFSQLRRRQQPVRVDREKELKHRRKRLFFPLLLFSSLSFVFASSTIDVAAPEMQIKKESEKMMAAAGGGAFPPPPPPLFLPSFSSFVYHHPARLQEEEG